MRSFEARPQGTPEGTQSASRRKPGIAFDNHTLSPICAGCIALQLDDGAAVIDAFHRFVGYALDMTRNTGR